ncbi:MAG: hypothetical protein ISS94_00365 [Candidatus Syntrophoarchaeum sp.]|nr:hypothetical protein [Candidatus Syntrophoarchaeum sp.]
MKLEIPEAISLILALPSHRSNNEGHRKMGEKALEFLFEYKELGSDEVENAFNRAMISSVLSAVRAFSVERDRIAEEWTAIEAVKNRRERLLDIFRNLSPLSRGNYWSKILLIVFSLGYSLKEITIGWQRVSVLTVSCIIIGIVILEILSKIFEFAFANYFEKKTPPEKETKWRKESMKRYKYIIEKFIEESIVLYKRFYPESTNPYGFDITSDEGVKRMKIVLIERHFHLQLGVSDHE